MKTAELFARYEKPLRTVFDFYCKLEDLEINEHLEIKGSTLPYRSFIKFANQMKLAPSLVATDEVVMIYKVIMKEKSETIRSLTYDDFLESLVRFAIRGNNKLEKGKVEEDTESKAATKKSTMLFFDVKEITVETVENLFKYIALSPGDKKLSITQRLMDLQREGVKGAQLKQKNSMSVPKDAEEVKGDGTNEATQMSGEFKGVEGGEEEAPKVSSPVPAKKPAKKA